MGSISAGGHRENVARLGISRSFQIPQLFIELTAAEKSDVWLFPVPARRRCHFIRRRGRAAAMTRRSNCWSALVLPTSANVRCRNLRAACANWSTLPWRWCGGRNCCSWTSRPPAFRRRKKFATMDRVIHAVAPDAATIVFVEHDMEIVSRYRTRGGVLSGPHSRRRRTRPRPERSEVRRYVTGGTQ